jgi:hypothetical protein
VLLLLAIYCLPSIAVLSAAAVVIGVLGNARWVNVYYALVAPGLLAILVYDRVTRGPDNSPLGALGYLMFYSWCLGYVISFGIFRMTLSWYRTRVAARSGHSLVSEPRTST